ncbi:MAG: M17 family metallopeptidase, partial [Bacteroidota bacterium]
MELLVESFENKAKYNSVLYLIANYSDINTLELHAATKTLANKKLSRCKDADFISIETADEIVFFVPTEKILDYETRENLRKTMHAVYLECVRSQIDTILFVNNQSSRENAYASVESFYLSSYRFVEYKTHTKEQYLMQIACVNIEQKDVTEIQKVCEGNFIARDFVNEPVITLSSTVFAERINSIFSETTADVQVYDKTWIEEQKMGGLLAVNRGSVDEPRFVHITWNPRHTSEKPIVLVGKGIIFDTGGLNLNPGQFMEHMKADMGGAAAVVGVMKTIVDLNIPINIQALIPITDNRLSGNAYAPGDVITMRNGTTVEVLNTDAEGRMILADALDYATELNPELTIDVATLTGAANMTVGEHAGVYMGTADSKYMHKMEEASLSVWEPLVKMPLWNMYDKQIESHIADIKNVGGPLAGAITAGKFLQKFIQYPWIHLDISGSA